MKKGFYMNAKGQAMVEYVIIMALLLASLAIFSIFRRTFDEYQDRALETVGSEYP